jgi:hypothetical protein
MSVQRTIAALEAHRIAARVLRGTIEQLSISQMDLAAIGNVARAVVRRWLDDDDCNGHAPLRLLLDPTVGPDLLRRFAEHHALVVSERRDSSPASWWSLHGDALESASAFSVELARALSPGGDGAEDLTNGELQALQAKHRELERIVASIGATLRQREQESASACGRASVTPIERRRG